jgi:hypothetical protein
LVTQTDARAPLPAARARFAAVLLFTALVAVFRAFDADDAAISYRHAQHLAAGRGPVMNPGERVEGVSNLPWTVVLGAATRCGVPTETAARVLAFGCGVAAVLLAGALAARIGAGVVASTTAMGLVATAAPLAAWSATGMETAAYTACVTAFLLALMNAPRNAGWGRAGAWLGAVAALRPEGIGFALAAVWQARSARAARREVVRLALGAAVVALPWLAFRLVYYGDWIPNPVHAKVNGLAAWAPGAVYVVKWGTAACLPLLLALRRPWSTATLVVAIGIGFALLSGGDHLPAYRFLVPIMPALAALATLRITKVSAAFLWVWLLLAVGLVCILRPQAFVAGLAPVLDLARVHRGLETHAPRLAEEVRHVGVVLAALAVWLACAAWLRARPRVVCGLAVLAFAVPQAFDPDVRAALHPDPAAAYGRAVGEWMRTHFPAGTLVATNAAGRLPYHARLPVIDMLGLTDRTIARGRADRRQWIGHERGDADYVLSRQPDVIVFGGPEGSVEPWPFHGDRELAAHPDFQRDYTLRRAALPGFEFVYWARRSFEP